jgi:hypothetical protein
MPLYGKALNLILSGVLALLEGFVKSLDGERSDNFVFEVCAIVVLRCILAVSAEGGRGSGGREFVSRIEARQRKHSPVPK